MRAMHECSSGCVVAMMAARLWPPRPPFPLRTWPNWSRASPKSKGWSPNSRSETPPRADLQRTLSDVKDEVAYLKVKLRREGKVTRDDTWPFAITLRRCESRRRAPGSARSL